jgi:hypothetical protein
VCCDCVELCIGSGLATDRSSKGPYRLCKKNYETEEEARAQLRAVEPLNGIRCIDVALLV